MPTVLRWQGVRFYFFSEEGNEPPHIHMDKAEKTAKVWLGDLSVAYNEGFTGKELKRLIAKIEEHRTEFIEVWNEHIGQTR